MLTAIVLTLAAVCMFPASARELREIEKALARERERAVRTSSFETEATAIRSRAANSNLPKLRREVANA